MFERFQSAFVEYLRQENYDINLTDSSSNYYHLLKLLGGRSYDNGLYTFYTFNESAKWKLLLSYYFKSFENKLLPFGYDWMGRQFCVSSVENKCIYMFDPATMEDFVLEESLDDFHNLTLANSKAANLASDLFYNVLLYLKIGGLSLNKCLGFKRPLFLNGEEVLSNYTLCDLEVYWEIEHQLYKQIQNMPDGTIVSTISVNPFTKED